MIWNPSELEKKWKEIWESSHLYKTEIDHKKPKYYVLDMFPYPSGAGLHVGHPLGYIASDIFSRFKRLNGFNVLHPMGYDAFGLPAEQYAIQTGVHPADSTMANIAQFRKQMDNIGFSFDWSREVMTCDPAYYKWTQWIFLLMFRAYYDFDTQKAYPITQLIERFKKSGTEGLHLAASVPMSFSSEEWEAMTNTEQEEILMNYRLMYRKLSMVNWCEALGTVLANDEVKDGVSERGGFPVVRKPMMQWSMRTTAYAERLLTGLELVDWPESLKIMQRNWIGKSEGAKVRFKIDGLNHEIEVFTTRPDTIFGATFMVMAPEHIWADNLTVADKKEEVLDYIESASLKEMSERTNAAKTMTGVFTGSYALHPFTGEKIPIYISDYVLIEYGTGAIMAVPDGDERDRRFAETFDIEIRKIIELNDASEGIESKNGKIINSGFLSNLSIPEAINKAIYEIESRGIGHKLVNYKLRDANFSRQRYWGEPFPIYYDHVGLPHGNKKEELPLELPIVTDFKPGGDGRSPLSKLNEWVHPAEGKTRETDTMPGFAGSSWYFLRYMDPRNNEEAFSKEAIDYWQDVDLYIGGAEHAVGHLLYARTWHKFLFDLGHTVSEEPFKKLINQGMIQGVSEKTFMLKDPQFALHFLGGDGQWIRRDLNRPTLVFLSEELIESYPDSGISNFENAISEMPVHIDFVKDYGASTGGYLDIDGINQFTNWRPDFEEAYFLTKEGFYHKGQFTRVLDGDSQRFNTKAEVEKMSKSKYNVINPDDVVNLYGADVFRMYEMFLGPLEMSKPWDIQGIEGVYKFAKRLWSLYFDEQGHSIVTDESPDEQELKVLHKTIKKVSEDIEKFSFNTCIPAFMIAVNELKKGRISKRSILEPLAILISPFAPFMSEELYASLGNTESVHKASWPVFDEKYTIDNIISYPICINGKKRDLVDFSIDTTEEDIIKTALAQPDIVKWMEGKPAKKVIVVKGKMVNIVV